jgi:glucose-1-phosphate adenylyltransferase
METPASLNDLQRATLAIVLAGGRGTRLGPLTNKRVKPAVHFGGKYRIIDFALSNCLNSGIRRIAVVTQYKAHSLMRHVQRGWGFLRGEFNEFIDLWPAQQRVEGATGIAARQTPCSRTSTSSVRYGRNTSSCWPATTSTRWTTLA